MGTKSGILQPVHKSCETCSSGVNILHFSFQIWSISVHHLDTSKIKFGKPITTVVKLAHLEQYSSLFTPDLDLGISVPHLDLSKIRFGKPFTALVKLANLEQYSSLFIPDLDLGISTPHVDPSKIKFGKPITALVKLAHLEEYSSLFIPDLDLGHFGTQFGPFMRTRV